MFSSLTFRNLSSHPHHLPSLLTDGFSARVVPRTDKTSFPANLQYSHLYRGVYPYLFPSAKPNYEHTNWQKDVDARLTWGISQAISLGVLSKGDVVVCVQGWRGGMGHTNTLRIVPAEDDLGLSWE